MPDQPSSFYLLFPGPWSSASEVEGHLARHGVGLAGGDGDHPTPGTAGVQLIHERGGFGNAALWGPPGRLSEEAISYANGSRSAALIEVGGRLDEGTEVCTAIGRAMLEAQAVLVRMEGSGLASGLKNWTESMGSKDNRDLVSASISFSGAGRGTFYTIGMNQFDRPEAEIGGVEAGEALRWLYEFCVYCLDEDPAFTTGHTFRPDAGMTRRTIVRWPDLRHSDQDGRHNRFGVWVALQPDAESVAPFDPVPVPVPAILVTLMAAERKKGRALLRSEVEGLVEAAPSIAMTPRDVQVLERSRGYVDLEPRLAWEQWQAVRDGTL